MTSEKEKLRNLNELRKETIDMISANTELYHIIENTYHDIDMHLIMLRAVELSPNDVYVEKRKDGWCIVKG